MIVNGKSFDKGNINTVYDLLKRLNLSSKKVVVEVNRDIISKANYKEVILNHEDKIEIIAFVGGG